MRSVWNEIWLRSPISPLCKLYRVLAMPASTQDLDLLAAANEVKIETQSGDRVHRTVIWMATENERLYVRSVRGDFGSLVSKSGHRS